MKPRTWFALYALLGVACLTAWVGHRLGWGAAWIIPLQVPILLAVWEVFPKAERRQGAYRARLAKGPMHSHWNPDTGRMEGCWDQLCHHDLWFEETA